MYNVRLMNPDLKEPYGIPQTDNQPHVIADIVDSDGNAASLSDVLNEILKTTELFTTFSDILKELKKMNLHLSIMTDVTVENQDVEI